MERAIVNHRFVLLSVPRSGTTNLIATLGKHPRIYNHREVFLDNYKVTVRQEFRDAFDMEKIRKDAIAFVDALLSFSPGPDCVGFKMFFPQSPEACKHLMSDHGVKKIVLNRENQLAAYSSNLIAKASGFSHQRADQENNRPLAASSYIRFNEEDFRRFCLRRGRIHKRYQKFCKGDVLNLNYTEVDDGVFAIVFQFLGLPAFEVSSHFKKLNPSDILSRFSREDHAQITATLDDLGHPEWVSEEMVGSGNLAKNAC